MHLFVIIALAVWLGIWLSRQSAFKLWAIAKVLGIIAAVGTVAFVILVVIVVAASH
jgi:hypothetical protein